MRSYPWDDEHMFSVYQHLNRWHIRVHNINIKKKKNDIFKEVNVHKNLPKVSSEKLKPVLMCQTFKIEL